MVRARAEGAETKGRGAANASLTSRMFTEKGKTVVTMEAEVGVSGIVAQFGRSGVIQQVSQQLVNRFAACAQEQLNAGADDRLK
jgi:carbon monoxide dehydrogenase subunit G